MEVTNEKLWLPKIVLHKTKNAANLNSNQYLNMKQGALNWKKNLIQVSLNLKIQHLI